MSVNLGDGPRYKRTIIADGNLRGEYHQKDKKDSDVTDLSDFMNVQDDEKSTDNNMEEAHFYSTEDVEIYEEPLTEEQVNELGSDQYVKVKTQAAAALLGVSDQLVRRYCDDFEEFLHVEKTTSGHRLFSKEDIEKLRLIIRLRKERNLTIEQTVDFLRSEGQSYNSLSPEMKLDVLIQVVSQTVTEAVNNALDENRRVLEDKRETLESIKQHEQEIISDYEKTIRELNERLATKDEMIERLIQNNNDNLEEIKNMIVESNETKKKRWPWSK